MVRAILTESLDTTNEYVIVAGASVMWPPATKRAFCLKFSPNFMSMIQFPPKMDGNWLRYELLNWGQIYETKLAEDIILCVHSTTSALNR